MAPVILKEFIAAVLFREHESQKAPSVVAAARYPKVGQKKEHILIYF